MSLTNTLPVESIVPGTITKMHEVSSRHALGTHAPMIVFGEDWGVHPSSTQHLVKRIARDRNILWVDSIGLRQPKLSARDMKRVWEKLAGKLSSRGSQLTPLLPGDFHLSPRVIPAPRGNLARWLSRMLLKQQIQRVTCDAGFNRPILWTSLPTAVDMIGHLDEIAVVYYAGDDFTALAGVDHETVSIREQELADKADLIITASALIAARFPQHKTRVLSHGVDYDLFARPTPRARRLDERPTAGFYGSISEWIDIDLMHEVASRLSHWRFVFIGNVETDVSKLHALDNIDFLGPVPHSELPQWSQHWQASLLPFVDNQQIRASNPLKLREYLAAGKPVVATWFPALQGYTDVVTVAATADEMTLGIEHSLDDHNTILRRSYVANESWDKKANILEQWLKGLEK